MTDSNSRKPSPSTPAPPLGLTHSYAKELEGLYLPASLQNAFAQPSLVAYNQPLADELGLPKLTEEDRANIFGGNRLPADAQPLAMAYAGHQFGHFAPILGDGRAALLGERIDGKGQRWDIQLKGAGPTPFSRGGDGRATLSAVLREYLVSHGMHQLGVPTTRMLAAVATGTTVVRNAHQPGGVVTRVARSHLRVGTFALFASQGDRPKLTRLLDYAIERHAVPRTDAGPSLDLLRFVADKQMALVAHWMSLGFIHGVMNTDNFAISGETIDFGPCAFMDRYDPSTVFSSIDRGGRYAYDNQPGIAQWNLARLAEALLALADDVDTMKETMIDIIEGAKATFETHYRRRFFQKLGLDADEAEAAAKAASSTSPEDDALLAGFLDGMQAGEMDFTSTFRRLSHGLREGEAALADSPLAEWETQWRNRLETENLQATGERMDRVNPVYIPRNHLVEEVLAEAEAGNLKPFRQFLRVLEDPFTEREGLAPYAEGAPASFYPYATYCGT